MKMSAEARKWKSRVISLEGEVKFLEDKLKKEKVWTMTLKRENRILKGQLGSPASEIFLTEQRATSPHPRPVTTEASSRLDKIVKHYKNALENEKRRTKKISVERGAVF